MHSINQFVEENLYELTNMSIDGLHTYYNRVTHHFVICEDCDVEYDDLVIAPCSYHVTYEGRKLFYDSLSDEDRVKARSYPFKRGYMDYLREIGLYDHLVECEYTAVLNEWKRWIKKNSFDISQDIVVEVY